MWFRLYVQKLNMSSLISNKNPNFPLERIQVHSAPQAQPVKSDSEAQSGAAANSVSSGSAGIRHRQLHEAFMYVSVGSICLRAHSADTQVCKGALFPHSAQIFLPSQKIMGEKQHDNVFTNIYARHFNAAFISQFE